MLANRKLCDACSISEKKKECCFDKIAKFGALRCAMRFSKQ